MTKLQLWMNKNCMDDAAVARHIKLSRPQVSRIRRGLCAAKVDSAKRLEALTGIKWHTFMDAKKAAR